MAAVIILIADAVTARLNEMEFSLPFPASRFYVPIHQLEDLSNLAVTVVPKAMKPNLLDRQGRTLTDYFIDIAVQKTIGNGPMTNAQINAACDPLMALAEEITDAFFLETLPIGGGNPIPRCIDVENVPIFAPEHLDMKRAFTTVVTLNFRLGK